jgi:hypothetical protein
VTGTAKGWHPGGTALGLVTLLLAGCGAAARPDSVDVSVDAPRVVDFRCTDERAELSGRYVSTSVDGVRVNLIDQSTAPAGETSYTYTFGGAVVGGGVLSKTPETVTLQQPPGVFELACRHDDQSSSPVRLHVVDNDYNYREPQRPSSFGCRPGGALYRTIHHGGTASEAVQAAIDWEADEHTYRVHELDGGYWRVPGYGFVLDRDGNAWAFGSVYLDESGRWTASLSSVCE